jgi:hypothetical protein
MEAKAEKAAMAAKEETVNKGQPHKQAIHGMTAINAIENQEKVEMVEEAATRDFQEEAALEEMVA